MMVRQLRVTVLVIALLSGFSPLKQQLSQQKETCVVEGRVVKAGSNEPVRKAFITLSKDQESVFRTSTDLDGRFRFVGIPAGSYSVQADKKGFVSRKWADVSGGTTSGYLDLEAGQSRRHIVIELVPAGVILGTIYDPDGDEVVGAGIEVRLLSAGSDGSVADYGYGSSDDLGGYRVFGLKPGRYLVCARLDSPDVASSKRLEQLTPEGQAPEREDIVPTCYPGTTNIGEATAVRVAPGEQVRVDLTLQRARTFVIRGQARPPAGIPIAEHFGVGLYSLADQGTTVQESSRPQITDKSGGFEILDVRAGSYVLVATVMHEETTYTGMANVTVSSRSVEGVLIDVVPNVVLSGKVHVPGKAVLEQAYVHLEWQGPQVLIGYGTGAIVNRDGTFRFEGVVEGEYILSFSDAGEGYFVESALLGSQALRDQPIQITSGVAYPQIEIRLGRSEASIEGRVVHDGHIVGGVLACILPKEKRRYWDLDCRPSDRSGSFRFERVRPGDYRVFAIENFETLGEMGESEAQNQVERLSTSVQVKPDSRIRIEANLIKSSPR